LERLLQMLDIGVFLQTFLPVFVGVILSFLLWFGGQWFIGYRRNKKARAAMLQEIEEEILMNIHLYDEIVRTIPGLLAQGEIPLHLPYRMRLEVYQYIVKSGEIRLINDMHKQRLIRLTGHLCSTFNTFIDNTEDILVTLIGKQNAVKLAHIRLNGLMEQAEDEKKLVLQWLKELQGEAPANEKQT